MSVSGQTHAEAIGLTGYATEADGIGGLVKSRVEDFRVEELSTKLSMDQRGRFTVARITLRNWETNRFIARLAKALGIPKERIFFAGTKLNEHEKARSSKILAPKAFHTGDGDVEMTEVDKSKPGETGCALQENPLHDNIDVEMIPAAPSNLGETPGRSDQAPAAEVEAAEPSSIVPAQVPTMAPATPRPPRRSSLPVVRMSTTSVAGGRRSADDLALIFANQNDKGTI